MIKSLEIISAFSSAIYNRIVNTEYETLIYIDRNELQNFDNGIEACFFIEKHDISSDVATLETDAKNCIIDIFYYPKVDTDSKLMYNISDLINEIFVRNIRVENEIIDIIETSTLISKDEVGEYVHFSATLDYLDYVYPFEEHELMGSFTLDI